MNGWDVFTWISAVVLACCGIGIFAFFLKDAREILRLERRDQDE